MVLENVLSSSSSPHRRSSSFKKPFPRDEFGSCSSLIERHRFLLTALVLLVLLCTIYLYFAITLGATETCFGLTGKEKALCHLEEAKASAATVKGKLKFL